MFKRRCSFYQLFHHIVIIIIIIIFIFLVSGAL